MDICLVASRCSLQDGQYLSINMCLYSSYIQEGQYLQVEAGGPYAKNLLANILNSYLQQTRGSTYK